TSPAIELEDVSLAAGINYRYDPGANGRIHLADTMGGGVGLIDFDGDGWLDIYFVNGCAVSADGSDPPSPNRLYHNLGGFTFRDGDGDLDLVAIAYVEIAREDALQCRDYSGRFIHCSPARYPAQADLLFQNDGKGTFTEVSQAAGFVGPNGRGLGLAIADFDS